MRDLAAKSYRNNVPAARRLRLDQTRSEELLWERLRDRRLRGLKFRRQHPIGGFVVDFYCAEYRVAIEVDGKIHQSPAQRAYDVRRQLALEEERDISFIRVRAEDVENDVDAVLARLSALIPLPPSPPRGEGGV